jgi:hypothetical protein
MVDNLATREMERYLVETTEGRSVRGGYNHVQMYEVVDEVVDEVREDVTPPGYRGENSGGENKRLLRVENDRELEGEGEDLKMEMVD